MGTVTKTGTITADVSSHDTTHYSYASVNSSYPLSNAYHGSSNTSYAQVNWKTGTNAETYVYLRFDFSSIPVNATITSVSASAKGYVNTTNSSRVVTRQMQLATGTTLKGSALTLSTSTNAQTFSTVGSWTRSELQSAGVRFYVKRGTSNTTSNYTLRLYGATMTVNYSWQETTYSVTVNNTSSVTVTANPSEVVSGEDCVIKADSISGITVKDNGTDVTSQFVLTQDQPESYSVTNITTTYGFALNNNNYYESNNKAHSSSAAVCRVDFYMPLSGTITFSLINYAEATYDYGLLSNIDATLNTNASADSSNVYWSGQNNNSASVQTVTYTMSAGNHFIYVKYFKDQYTDSNNDSLQFKVAITLDGTPSYDPYYAYTISNVQANHTIVVAAVATNKLWFKAASGGGETAIVSLGIWGTSGRVSTYTRSADLSALVSGQTYHIVSSGSATIPGLASTDWEIDTSTQYTSGVSLPFSETFSSNYGSYTYIVSSITISGTGITINTRGSGEMQVAMSEFIVYSSSSGGWTEVVKAYKKINGSWVEQTDLTNVFSSGTNYVKGGA